MNLATFLLKKNERPVFKATIETKQWLSVDDESDVEPEMEIVYSSKHDRDEIDAVLLLAADAAAYAEGYEDDRLQAEKRDAEDSSDVPELS